MLGMSAFLVCAPAIPRVFDDTGVVFGLGFLAVVVVHTALCTRSHGWDSIWSAVTMRVQLGSLDPAHFVERHGLLLIVAFGESVIAIGIGIGDLPLTADLFGGAFLSLALVIALWWTHFVRDEEPAEAAFRRTPAPARFRLATNAYYYAFLPMLLGIAYLAAGVKKTLGHLTEILHTGPALALAGGVALFLTGDVAFRAVPRLYPVRFRATATPLALTTAPFGIHLSAATELLAPVAALVGMPAAEARRGVRSAEFQDLARAWYERRVCSVCSRMSSVASCSFRSAIAAIRSRCSIHDCAPRWRATGV